MALRIVQWNCGGLGHVTGEAKTLLADSDIILLQETQKLVDDKLFSGFKVFQLQPQANIQGRDSGGTAVLISTAIPFIPTAVQLNDDGVCWVRLIWRSNNSPGILVGSVYFYLESLGRYDDEVPYLMKTCIDLHR